MNQHHRRSAFALLVLATLGLVASIALAADPPVNVTEGEWSTWDRISVVYPNETEFNVVFDSLIHTESGDCYAGGQFYVDPDNAGYETLVSTLQMAFAADKEVRIVWTGYTRAGATGTCRGEISRLMVR